jgi:hypothetical protein
VGKTAGKTQRAGEVRDVNERSEVWERRDGEGEE